MLVERDQVAAPFQRRRNPLDALATGGNRSHPVGGPQRIDLQLFIGQFTGDRHRPIGVLGCLRPEVGVEIDMAMGRDQRPGLAAAVAELNGKLARPLKRLQRLRNGGPMVQSDHIIGAPEPQQRFHLLGRRALFCRLAHGKLQVGGGLAAPKQTQKQLATRSERRPSHRSGAGEFGCPREKSQRLRRRESRGRRTTRPMQVLCRPLPGARLHHVVGEVADMFVEVPGVNTFEGVGDTAVQALPAHERHPAKKGLTDLLVGKDEARLPALVGHHQPSPLGLVQGVEQIVLLLLGNRHQELKGEGPSDTGGGGQDALGGFADAVDAASEHKPNRLGHLDFADLDLWQPLACRIGQATLLGQVPIDLFHEEGDTFGFMKYQLHQRFGRLLTGKRTQHGRDLDGVQPLERDARDGLQPRQMFDAAHEWVSGMEVDVAVCPDHQQLRTPDVSRHALE